MVKTQYWQDTALYQEAQGFRLRNVSNAKAIVALNRADNVAPDRIMATAIQNETEVIPIFTAPCASRVLRCYVNGTPFVLMAAGGTVTVTFTKSVIGAANVNLTTALTVGQADAAPTTDTALDATLVGGATSDLLEGQHVYATLAVSNHAVATSVGYLSINVEWAPTEQ